MGNDVTQPGVLPERTISPIDFILEQGREEQEAHPRMGIVRSYCKSDYPQIPSVSYNTTMTKTPTLHFAQILLYYSGSRQ